MNTFFLFLCFLIFLLIPPSQSQPQHFTRTRFLSKRHLQQYFEVGYPPPSHEQTPSCSHRILHHSFANTIDSPPYSTPYSPPSYCPPPWSRVVLHFHANCKGQQYDRIAALWLGGVELLRTSTAEPTDSGIFWNVRKDVTRYSSLLARHDLNLTMMLENVVDHEFTGVYHVTVTLAFYSSLMQKPDLTDFWDLMDSPADLIIPISDDGKRGFWFKVESENDLSSRRINIPRNTHRAILELYVSFHGNDEFWYSNPPNSYIEKNGLTTGRGNGSYREVYVTIDGQIVGSEIPFPVIFTGGINPLFWEPMVAIGAFDLPSYDMDLTPFLGKLLDGKEHIFRIGISGGISFWLVNANLHLWLDQKSSIVRANWIFHHCPETCIDRQEKFSGLDGSFEVEAEKESQITGWVASSAGNITTVISQIFSFNNAITFQHNGTYKFVQQRFKAKKTMKLLNAKGELITGLKIKRKYPLRVITSTEASEKEKERYRVVTNVWHGLREKYYNGGYLVNVVSNEQDSKGWMEVEGHSVLSGEASTRQSYSYSDGFNCYSREVAATDGNIVTDNSTFACESSL